jgi:uncharacterized protein
MLTAQPPVQTLDEVLDRLRAALPDLKARYPIERLGVFGSFARGEQRADSDVDILVCFNGVLGLEIVDLWEDLKAVTGKEVSMLSERSLKPRMRLCVEPDLVLVNA